MSHIDDFPTNQELTNGCYPLDVHANEKATPADGNGPDSFVGYLSKFICVSLAILIPQFVMVALFLHISPGRLTQPFLLILVSAFLTGLLVYLTRRNRGRPIVFSLFISLGVGLYLLVFQLVVIHFGMEFGLIREEFRGTRFPVALLVSVIVPVIIFFRSKQRIEARLRSLPD